MKTQRLFFALILLGLSLQNSFSQKIDYLDIRDKNKDFIWDLVFSYARLKECEQTKHYLELYEKHTPKKYLGESHDKEVGQILALCHFD